MFEFNLIREPWIPVTIDGRSVEVSLRDALVRAHEIDGLGLDDPLQIVAIFRQILLPITLHALGLPRNEGEWAARWEVKRLDAATIEDYLAERESRFDLFHSQWPFAQVAGLRTEKNETKPISLLLPAIATGNNVPLFTARTEAAPPALTPAEAARAMLAAHCWDTAAIKSGAVGDPQVKNGKTTGNPTGPLGQLGVVLPVGATLAQTLMLNTPIVPQGLRPADRPQWDSDESVSALWRERECRGLLDLLTWPARRVRLVPETHNGAGGAVVVRAVVLAAGDRLDHLPEYEPHTAWRADRKATAKSGPRRPIRHQPGRAGWRGLTSLLATKQPTAKGESSSTLMSQLGNLRAEDWVPADLRLQVLSVGVAYGNQSAVVEDVLTDLIPLPVTALTADSHVRGLLLQMVAEAEDLRDAANYLGDELRRAVGADKLPWDKGLRLGEALVHELGAAARRLLTGLQREPDRVTEAEAAWHDAARRLAMATVEPALAAAPPEAFLGRQAEGKPTYRLSLAEVRFRRKLNEILGPPARAAVAGG